MLGKVSILLSDNTLHKETATNRLNSTNTHNNMQQKANIKQQNKKKSVISITIHEM